MSARKVRPRLALVELECRTVPTYLGNQIFPLDSAWNQNVANAPVASNSTAIINHLIGRGNARLHPDFGNPVSDGELYGIPITVVDNTFPLRTIYIPNGAGGVGYPGESDIVQVPIPDSAVIEGDGPTGPRPPNQRGDSHVLVYNRDTNILYELYQAIRPSETTFPYGGTKPNNGLWGAYQISRWDLNQNSFRPLGWTSADAAGLPILPGLVRPDEAITQGVINHAIRFTVHDTRGEYVYPASHEASNKVGDHLPRMGERFRLRADFPVNPSWTPEAKAIALAMKTYGLIVADNGSDMYYQGVPSTQWDMDGILDLQDVIRADDFEVVDLTPIITNLSQTQGPLAGGTTVTITGQNFSGAAGRLAVMFGTTPATSFTIVSDTRIDAVAPAGAGTVSVRVRSGQNGTDSNLGTVFFGYGTSADTNADNFTYTNSPLGPPPPPTPIPPVPPVPPVVPPTVPPPPATLPIAQPFAVGSDRGTVATATLVNADGTVRFTVKPFGDAFTGGVRVASADVNGDGLNDLVVGTGTGVATRVIVYSGDGGEVLLDVAPFEAAFTGGVFVAAGDITGDGKAEVVVSPDEGGGPRVRVFRGGTFDPLADFLGIDDPNFRGGARAAIGDVNRDGLGDLLVSAGFQGGPRVAGYDGRGLTNGSRVKAFPDFFAFEETVRNGVFIAGGDLDGDGFADVIVGGGPGGGPRVSAFGGKLLVEGGGAVRQTDFFAGEQENRGGVRVAVTDLEANGRPELVAGAGSGGGNRVTVYRGDAVALAFDAVPGFAGGVFVG